MDCLELKINRKNTNSIKWNGELLKKWCGFGDEETLSFWVADMDFKSPEAIRKAMHEVAEEGIYGYSDFTEEYYTSIIGWYRKRFKVEIEKEWISYSNGIVPALNYILQEFCLAGDKVILQQPVYYPFTQAAQNNGIEILDNQLILRNNRYEIDFENLEALTRDPQAKIMFFCNPHNPGGRVWSEKEVFRVLEICRENNVVVVSDEIHCDIIYEGFEHIPAVKFHKQFDNIILCSSPSKTFNIAGLQTSNIIIPNLSLRERFQKALNRNSILLPNIFGIKAVEAAYNHCVPWLEELLEYLQGNLKLLEDLLEKHLPQAKLMRPEGTFLVWIDMSMVEKDYLKRSKDIVERANVALDNGFIFGECGKNFERLNIACSRDILEEGVLRIAEIYKKGE